MKLDLYQIDSFTDTLFKGNPAAVCPLVHWLPDAVMQQIALENNLSETAFFVEESDVFTIRWFTPTTEVDLCGHATLAAAFVIFNCLDFKEDIIVFNTLHSGQLRVRKHEDVIIMDFPTDKIEQLILSDELIGCTNQIPIEAWKGKDDMMLVFKNQEQISQMIPDLSKIAELEARGLIVTAPGDEVDFVSRFFGPQSGVNEDPVTGSAHTTLTPYWAKKLGKKSLHAKQLSSRTGELHCTLHEDRVRLSGQAQLYLKGSCFLNE